MFGVQKIILDLAELPGIFVHDPLELRQHAMERKARVQNLPGAFRAIQKIRHAESRCRFHSAPFKEWIR